MQIIKLTMISLCVTLATQLGFLAGLRHFNSEVKMPSFAPVLANVMSSVVTLRVSGERYVPKELQPRGVIRTLAPKPIETRPYRTGGSGVVIDAAEGYILTNSHVVESATTIDVGLADGRRIPGALVGRDAGTDLALIKVEPVNLTSLPIGNSDRVRVGDWVVAVGNPFGLEGTATLGIVSAVMRTELGHEAFEDYLQIDAQINPGNSGGALVNSKGELIGINTAMGGLRGRSFSIGFAIPINMAMTITHQIRLHRRMHRGSLGVTVDDLVTERGRATRQPLTGAIVTDVVASTPAESAGIKRGDIIVEVAGKPVRNASEFAMRVATVPLGGQVQVKMYSNDHDRKVTVRVIDAEIKPVQKVLSPATGTIAGAAIGDIMPGSVLYGDIRGAQILEAPMDSPAYAAGLSAGDVVTAIDGQNVFSSEDLLRYLNEAGASYRVDIVRNGIPYWLQAQK